MSAIDPEISRVFEGTGYLNELGKGDDGFGGTPDTIVELIASVATHGVEITWTPTKDSGIPEAYTDGRKLVPSLSTADFIREMADLLVGVSQEDLAAKTKDYLLAMLEPKLVAQMGDDFLDKLLGGEDGFDILLREAAQEAI